MKYCRLLAIDESGKASYAHKSEVFAISGITMPETVKPKIDRLTRKLKKKYFGDEDIVFHSRDMVRKRGPFHILQDTNTEMNFWSEYISIVNNDKIAVYFILTDKENAEKQCWQSKTILSRSYIKLLETFAKSLYPSFSGKIIAESAPSQDFELIKAHNKLQNSGVKGSKIKPSDYRDLITSLSLVNKNNYDPDVQIADSFAPIAILKYRIEKKDNTDPISKVNKWKLRLIDRKLRNRSNKSLFTVLI